MDRAPTVAGRFYPGDGATLRAEVARCTGLELESTEAVAVVAPHAGYMYSGAVAGAVYARVRVPSVAVILGPNHTGHGDRAAIMTHGNWRLPDAHVPIEASFAEDVRRVALLTEDEQAHAYEHSLEVHLPFLMYRNPKVRIVPICLAMTPYASCVRIGHAIADVIASHGRDALLVASTDMSHYIPAEEARVKDRRALDHVEALDAEGLYHTVLDEDISMCGVIPTTVTLVAAKALGATRAELVRYGNSGDTSGDYDRVVGYAGLLIR